MDNCLFAMCACERKRKERVMPQKHRRVGLYVCVFAFLDRVKTTCSPSLFIKGLWETRTLSYNFFALNLSLTSKHGFSYISLFWVLK